MTEKELFERISASIVKNTNENPWVTYSEVKKEIRFLEFEGTSLIDNHKKWMEVTKFITDKLGI